MDSKQTADWVAPPSTELRTGPIYLVGFAPVAVFVLLSVLAPGFFAPMLDTSAPAGGAWIGLPLLLLAAALMVAGIAVMWRFRLPWVAALAVLFLTLPSIVLLLMGPAICLIAQNLAI